MRNRLRQHQAKGESCGNFAFDLHHHLPISEFPLMIGEFPYPMISEFPDPLMINEFPLMIGRCHKALPQSRSGFRLPRAPAQVARA
jgi:hypothetical protein